MLFNWFGINKNTTEQRLDIIEKRLGSLLDKHIIEDKIKLEELEREIKLIGLYFKKYVLPLQDFLGYEIVTEYEDDPRYGPPPPTPKIEVYKMVKKPNKK